MKKLSPPLYIDSRAALEAWVERLAEAQIIAVDTESDSFHHYHEKVCLIQMTALGQDVIVDPLALEDLEPLRPIFADPSKTKIFHDAGYDLACLWRDYEMQVRGVFDTMLASRILGSRNFGLATILLERYNFEADKRLQRSDWARRPLTEAQIDYARFDTHFLPDLMAKLEDELKAAGRLAWALEDFDRASDNATAQAPRRSRDDPDAWWRIRGVKQLSAAAKGRVRSLYRVREEIAGEIDRPPFRVFSDAVILDLAIEPPAEVDMLPPRRGLRRAGVERFGARILRALNDAEQVKEKPPTGIGRRRRNGKFLDPEARRRYELLRDWRRREADELGIEPEVVVANSTLEALAKEGRVTRAVVCAQPQLQGWREAVLVDSVVELLSDGGNDRK